MGAWHGQVLRELLMTFARTLGAAFLTSVLAGCGAVQLVPPTPPCQSCYVEGARSEGSRLYLLVFASQSTPKLPRYTHTWATVVRVRRQGPNRPLEIDCETISWLPASLQIRTWDLRIEPGLNLDLRQTIDLLRAQGQRISLWGPYEIEPELYCHFLKQKAFLESGRVGYQALDELGEAGITGNGLNCIHAVANCDERIGCPLWSFGESAGESIVENLADYGALVRSTQSHDWLISALGLNDYHIHRRGPPCIVEE
jgi:hypothetical protein